MQVTLKMSKQTLKRLISLLRGENWDIEEKSVFSQLKQYEADI